LAIFTGEFIRFIYRQYETFTGFANNTGNSLVRWRPRWRLQPERKRRRYPQLAEYVPAKNIQYRDQSTRFTQTGGVGNE
jgi:hypothetical protein